jgi:hypothetical protein
VAHRPLVAHADDRRRQRRERGRARPHDADLPIDDAGHGAALQHRNQARAHERRLATPRRTEDGEQPRLLELLDESLDLAIAPEEELGVIDVEDLETAVRTDVVARAVRDGGSERDALDRVNEILQGSRIAVPGAEVDPCAGAQECGRSLESNGSRTPGSRTGKTRNPRTFAARSIAKATS